MNNFTNYCTEQLKQIVADSHDYPDAGEIAVHATTRRLMEIELQQRNKNFINSLAKKIKGEL
jgi:hypothetical protein